MINRSKHTYRLEIRGPMLCCWWTMVAVRIFSNWTWLAHNIPLSHWSSNTCTFPVGECASASTGNVHRYRRGVCIGIDGECASASTGNVHRHRRGMCIGIDGECASASTGNVHRHRRRECASASTGNVHRHRRGMCIGIDDECASASTGNVHRHRRGMCIGIDDECASASTGNVHRHRRGMCIGIDGECASASTGNVHRHQRGMCIGIYGECASGRWLYIGPIWVHDSLKHELIVYNYVNPLTPAVVSKSLEMIDSPTYVLACQEPTALDSDINLVVQVCEKLDACMPQCVCCMQASSNAPATLRNQGNS